MNYELRIKKLLKIVRRILFPLKNLSKRKQRALTGIALIIIVIGMPILVYFLKHAGISEAAWFDTNWSFRQTVPITNSGSAQTDYQIAITLDTATLITNGKMQSNCNDIRITDINGKLLPFWIETGTTGAGGKACNASTTQIWTKVPSIPTSGQTIYLYYGNPQAQSTQNGNKVFEFFDDFSSSTIDSSKWTQGTIGATVGTNFSQSGGNLIGGDTNRYIQTISPYSGDYIAETRINTASPATNGFSTVGFYASSSNSFGILDHNGTSYYRNDSGWVNFTYNGSGQWNRDKVKIVGTNATYWRTGETSGSATATGITNSGISGEYLRLGARSDDGAFDQNYSATWDWILIRKTAATEPSVGSPTNEEIGAAPAVYLKFDEGTGTTAKDSSSNGFNGTITGATWKSGSDCISGNCLYFNGLSSGNKIDLGTSAKLNPTNFTVSAWVKTNDSSLTYNYIFSSDRDCCGTYNGIGFYINSSSKLVGNIWNSTNNAITSNQSLSSNKWYFVTFSYDGNNMELYINGVLDKTTAYAGGVGSPASFNASVGTMGNGQGTYTFKGYIDEFKLYSYARTAAQVQSDYNSRGSGIAAANVLGASTANQNLSNGLVGFWKMDEATWSGTLNEVVDSSGNANNGQAQGGTNDMPYPTTGKFGNGGFFDGTDDYINAGNGSSLNLGANDFTASAWVYPTTTSSKYFLQRSDLNDGWLIGLNSSNIIVEVRENGTTNGVQLSYATTIQINTWYQITVVKTGTNITVYKNGVSVGTQAAYQNLSNSSVSFQIGRVDWWPPGNFQGQIDEVRLYNRALSPAEVQQLYNYAPGPVAYWNFEEGQGGTVNDISGNSLTGTMTNGATWTSGKYGKAGNFNGSSVRQGVQVSNNALLNPGTGSFTTEAWVKTTQTGSWKRITTKRGSSTTWYSMAVNNGKLAFETAVSYPTYYTNGTGNKTINDGQWHHVVMVRDTSQSKVLLYVDGTLDINPSDDTAGQSITNSEIFEIGTWGSEAYDSGSYTGAIDQVQTYNYARTSGQIVSDMNGGHPAGGSPVGSAVAYWKFDEGYGTTANNSGNGGPTYNGNITSAVFNNDGKFGKAMSFNGATGQYVSVPAISSITSGTPFTISAWVRPGNTGDYRTIMGYDGTHRLLISATGQMLSQQNGNFFSNAAGDVPDNTWTYVAYLFDGTQEKWYINGKQSGNSHALTTAAWNSAFKIGQYDNVNYPYKGLIDEVKVYNSALSSSDILIDYNHGSSLAFGVLGTSTSDGITASNSAATAYCIPGDTSTCSSPVGEWNFEEGQGTTANDISGNGNTGIWNGTGTSHWSSGKYGKAGNFNGSNDIVTLTNNPIHGATIFTISAWIYKTNTTSGDIVSNRNYPVSGNVVGIAFEYANNVGNGINNQSLTVANGNTLGAQNSVWSTPTNSIAQNTWYHVTLIWQDGSTPKIYINGINQTLTPWSFSTSTTINWGPSNVAPGIGQDSQAYAPTPFAGKIDQVRIFNYARSAAQVAYDYNRGAPVGYWKLDECQGSTANDSSGNGNTGTINIGGTGSQTSAGTCTTAGTAWGNGATGKYNASLNFDGTDDYVSVPDNSSLTFANGTIATFSFWFKNTTRDTTDRSLLIKGTAVSGNENYDFRLYDNTVRFIYRGSGTWQGFGNSTNGTSDSITINTGQWYHIVFTYTFGTASSAKFYVNGTLQTGLSWTVGTGNVAPTTNSNVLAIGGSIPGSLNNYFPGQLDDVRIYNYALSPSQIRLLYNQGAGVRFGPNTGTP